VSILEGVVQRGTAVRLKSLGYPLAGKTGTTNRSKDTWFIGFSPNLAVGVFAGFDDPRSLGKRETGSSVAVPIFKEFMEKALEGTAPVPFRQPEGIRNVKINAATGARARPGDEFTIWESFLIGTEPTEQMYILDENGVNPMPQGGYGGYISDNGVMVPGYGYGTENSYGTESGQGNYSTDAGYNYNFNPQPAAPTETGNSATTGTGGLY
jgi:penicillin-binding protein 1A